MSPAGERDRRPTPGTASTTSGTSGRAEESAAEPTATTPLWARTPRRVDREVEADSLAAHALRSTPEPGRALRNLHPAPAPAEVESGADRLPVRERADFSARFGYDLSEVRLHGAYDGARDLGADAFALGRVVAFAPGAFDPTTPRGRALLAHELAHVVLERGEPPAVSTQKSPPTPTTFYPEVEDAFQRSWGHHELAIRPVLQLCQVVESEQGAEVEKALVAVEKTNVHLLPTFVPRTSTAAELMARLMLMGRPAQAMRFRTWQVSLLDVYGRSGTVATTFDTEAWLTEDALGRLRTKISWSDPKGALTLLDAELGLIPVLVRELQGLDPKQVAEDRKRLAANTDPFTQPGFGNQSGDHLTIHLWELKLAALARAAFIDAQAPVQALMDLAAADLAAGRGDATLVALEQRLATMAGLSMPQTGLENNTTEYRSKGRKDVLVQVDSWLDQPGAKDRKAQLDSYDVEDERSNIYPRPDQPVEPGRILALRQRQINVLKLIHGQELDKSGKNRTSDTLENEAAAKTLGKDGLNLHSDDDWRRFLLAKYTARRATSSAEVAFESLLDLLKVYLKTFTTHSPFNMDDFGDSFLTMQFPRALTGQLVHDCGVYALRIAYMLSLVREEPTLKLQTRFVQLPVHIGLIITSSTAPIGAYLVHNDDVTHYDQTAIDAMRAKFDVTDEQGQPRPAAKHNAATDDAFLGELATDAFVQITDAPYAVSAVPHLSGAAAADKSSLWAAYQQTLKAKLFGKVAEDPKSPYYQFHLRYLDLLKATKTHHNEKLVPFWKEGGHAAWKAHKDKLKAADDARTKASTPAEKGQAEANFASARKAYLEAETEREELPAGSQAKVKVKRQLEAWFDEVDAAYTSHVVPKSHAISNDVVADPSVIGPGASRASALRLMEVLDPDIDPGWKVEVGRHFTALKAGSFDEPRYADEKELLDRID
ncbi:DUF4157 domain-containing protein [Nocardioides sp.]|uniref:eCIS core domain-containing protein n=1 Tax=Nocardioides sp. TaxID=35761 RepID=UPI002C056D2E|nr:DUF4157 domain-containing protein [Nocardioides sp.]HXH78122.1 DUF4157 domain-containing protein [Nocardioides sp.]